MLLAALSLSTTTVGSLQQPINVIPRNQPPLLTVMRPTPDDKTSKATEKVILLSREKVGSPDVWDFLACAWEFLPDNPTNPITKRVTFAHSSWNPDFLAVIPEHTADDYLELKMDNDTVNLYRIDFRNWDVKVLSTNEWFNDYALGGNYIYLFSKNGVHRLHRLTGQLEATEPRFSREAEFEKSWLVHMDDAPPAEMQSLDPAEHVFWRQLQLEDMVQQRVWGMTFSPAQRYLAYVRLPDRNASGIPRKCNTQIVLYDLEKKTFQEHPVEVFVGIVRGSGLLYLPHARLWFSGADTLKLQSGIPEENGNGENLAVTETTIQLPDGKRRDEKISSLKPDRDRLADYYIPAYLGHIKDTSDPEQDLAFAFLKHKWVFFIRPEAWDETIVAFSADKKRFLLKWWKGWHRDTFFLGDLEHNTLKKIPSPLELREDNALEMRWVKPGK